MRRRAVHNYFPMSWAAATLLILLLAGACDLLPTDIVPPPGGSPPVSSGTPEPTATVTLAPVEPQPTLTPLPPEGGGPERPVAGITETPGPIVTLPPPKTPTATATLDLPDFVVQPGSPINVQNFSHPELGCDWLGVAGQAFDTAGQPVRFLVVVAGGTLAGGEVNDLTVTGSAPIYGPGGYELTLAQRPLGSTGTIWIQLFDLEGKPLSERIVLDTVNDCSRNLILLNFLKLPGPDDQTSSQPLYLPLIRKDAVATP